MENEKEKVRGPQEFLTEIAVLDTELEKEREERQELVRQMDSLVDKNLRLKNVFQGLYTEHMVLKNWVETLRKVAGVPGWKYSVSEVERELDKRLEVALPKDL